MEGGKLAICDANVEGDAFSSFSIAKNHCLSAPSRKMKTHFATRNVEALFQIAKNHCLSAPSRKMKYTFRYQER